MTPINHRFEAENRAKRAEKKADYLIPQAVQRFNNGGDDMFEERAPVPDGLPLPHDFIVTKAASVRIYSTPRLVNCRYINGRGL
jgi:hypothetical protein